MKIVIEIDDDKLPLPYQTNNQAGIENIILFFHENLVCRQVEKYQTALVCGGSQSILHIRRQYAWDAELGKLLMSGLTIVDDIED